MKVFIKITKLFLILFLFFLIKKFIYIRLNTKLITYSYNETNIIDNINETTEFKMGKVLYQKPYQINKYMYIIGNNLKKDDYVINNDGMVGKVIKEYDNYSLIKLVTNENFIIQVEINDCFGILDNNRVTNVNNDCKINNGDKVYTSKLDSINKKVLIGSIKSINKDKNGVNNIYNIDYSINYNNLSNLLILSRDIS